MSDQAVGMQEVAELITRREFAPRALRGETPNEEEIRLFIRGFISLVRRASNGDRQPYIDFMIARGYEVRELPQPDGKINIEVTLPRREDN